MHNHDNEHSDRAYQNPFFIPLLWICSFAAIELVGGLWTNSLALIGDSGHMVTDALALGLAMFASHHAQKRLNESSGMGMEIKVSIINAALMLLVVGWIAFEAIERFQQPQMIAGGYVMLIAFIGLLVNVIVARYMHQQSHCHSEGGDEGGELNHRAAFLHVISDLLGSVAALIAGGVVYFTGWLMIDPILSLFISALILLGTLNLMRDIWRKIYKT